MGGELDKRGCGELLITSIENDGMMGGYQIDLIRSRTESINYPVIASVRAGNCHHMIDVVKLAGASTISSASVVHFT